MCKKLHKSVDIEVFDLLSILHDMNKNANKAEWKDLDTLRSSQHEQEKRISGKQFYDHLEKIMNHLKTNSSSMLVTLQLEKHKGL